MNQEQGRNPDELSLHDLFRREIETQSAILTDGLLAIEHDPSATERLNELMRAAHSLKGAALIVGCQAVVHVAHAMEDCFVAAQKQKIRIDRFVDKLLAGVDLLECAARVPEQSFDAWEAEHRQQIDGIVVGLNPRVERRV